MKKYFGKLLSLILFMYMPIFVNALETDGYIHYDNIKTGGEDFNGMSWGNNEVEITMKDLSEYSFDLKGYNLDEDETYVFELKSDFVGFSKEYTGQELLDGISISRNDGNGTINSRIYLKTTKEVLKSKVTTYEDVYEKISFRFNDNFDSTEIDALYKKIAKNGVVELDAIELENEALSETIISSALSKYETETGKFWIYGYCFEGKCHLCISDTENTYRYKDFEVEYKYKEADKEVLKRANDYLKKFEITDDDDEDNWEPTFYFLEDLENINYKYMIIKHGKEDMTTINNVINYSSEIKKMLDYGNFTAILDTRAGWGEEFTAGGFGYLNLAYNGIIYGAADRVGIKQVNVLYVPDNTENTRDAYIATALKRVRDYLPNAKVELKYAGQIDDIDQTDWIVGIDELIDVNKTLGEYYTLTIDGEDLSFFIVKDSSKMNNPEMNTVDLKTNIKINSDSYEVPLDSKIDALVLGNDSKEYKDVINKLKLDKGMVVDLSLFSGLTDAYVTKLNNGSFKVFIPLAKEYLNKKLNAYYIKDDGSIETHNVKIENGYAIFETNHFSTYTIGESGIKNPATVDNIGMWIMLAIISILGLVFAFVYKTKKSM